jgi:hypothetical protein
MRNLLSGLIAVAWGLSPSLAHAQRNMLTQEEIAQGWLLLFDGKTTGAWDIEGHAKVEDGVLVLGGDRATRAVPTTSLGRTFELRLEYRTDKGTWVSPKPGWNIPIEVGWDTSGFLQRSFHGGTLERQSKDENEWLEIIYTGEFDPANGRRSVKARCRAVGEAAFVSREQGATTATGGTRVVFEITSGAKLHLRNIKLKTEAVEAPSIFLWLAVAFGILMGGLGVTLVIWHRRRRIPAPFIAPTQVANGSV